MRLLLTSAGIRNESIKAVLRNLVRQPLGGARLAFVVTAAVAQSGHHDWFVADINRVYGLGWREFDMVEINGLPQTAVLRRLETADVIYVSGGNAYHLARGIAEGNLAGDLLRLLDHKVYVGASAGSMIFTRRLTDRMTALYGGGDELYRLNDRRPVSPIDLFDWWIEPHVDFASWDASRLEQLRCPVYSIDDQTALCVVDHHVEVISEGRWRLVDAIREQEPDLGA